MTSTPQSDRKGEPEGAELGALAHAVARHARRKKALGRKVRATKKSPAVPPQKSASGPAKRAPAPWHVREPETAGAAGSKAGTASGHTAEQSTSRREAAGQPAVPGSRSTSGTSVPTPARRPTAAKSAHPPARSAADVAAQAAAAQDLDELRAAVSQCEACGLCKTRTQTVFMDGAGGRGVLFVGEAPGADEDRTGVPFVGRSGQLLTDIIEKGMGIPRSEVHIANVLKCRPPENRDPTPEEKAICTPWLDRQIELLDPKVIIPLGRHAASHVLGIQAPMGALRKKVHDKGTRKVVPTFHPSYLLRSPGEKKECWKDIQLAMDVLGIARKGGGSQE
jgi:uracil-DNA glycosylase family 4